MDAILVYPPLSLEERYGELAPAGHVSPPLSIMAIAAYIRQKGFSVEIVDCEISHYNTTKAADYILSKNPNFVGLTACTISIESAAKLANKIKNLNKDIITVVGGVHISAVPDETMKAYREFDIGVLNEGEITFLELLEGKKPFDDIDGLIFRKNGELAKTKKRERIKDLDILPIPAWDLIPDLIKFYRPAAHLIGRFPTTTITTSRGCAAKCTFCDRSVFGNRVTAHSAKYVVGIMKHLHETFGVKDIVMGDDNFVVLSSRLRDVCNLLIQSKMDLTWSCFTRIHYLTPELLKLMKESGCHEIAFGIETASQKTLDFLKKGIKIEQAVIDLENTQKAGMRTSGFFMIGIPGENKEDIENTIKFAKKVKLDMLQLSFFTPFPGDDIYPVIRQYGKFEENYSLMSAFQILFEPAGISKDVLMKYYRKAYREFYMRPRIVLSFIRQFDKFTDVFKFWSVFVALIKLAFPFPWKKS
jgi:anaerobic magnesium-protoporphyrin IX monomethyl ester cyclase